MLARASYRVGMQDVGSDPTISTNLYKRDIAFNGDDLV